jgi:hypothetical protein
MHADIHATARDDSCEQIEHHCAPGQRNTCIRAVTQTGGSLQHLGCAWRAEARCSGQVALSKFNIAPLDRTNNFILKCSLCNHSASVHSIWEGGEHAPTSHSSTKRGLCRSASPKPWPLSRVSSSVTLTLHPTVGSVPLAGFPCAMRCATHVFPLPAQRACWASTLHRLPWLLLAALHGRMLLPKGICCVTRLDPERSLHALGRTLPQKYEQLGRALFSSGARGHCEYCTFRLVHDSPEFPTITTRTEGTRSALFLPLLPARKLVIVLWQ